MQYLLMCCFEEDLWVKIPESQRDKVMQDYNKWVQDEPISISDFGTVGVATRHADCRPNPL
jgi:hypothetical protein